MLLHISFKAPKFHNIKIAGKKKSKELTISYPPEADFNGCASRVTENFAEVLDKINECQRKFWEDGAPLITSKLVSMRKGRDEPTFSAALEFEVVKELISMLLSSSSEIVSTGLFCN